MVILCDILFLNVTLNDLIADHTVIHDDSQYSIVFKIDHPIFLIYTF